MASIEALVDKLRQAIDSGRIDVILSAEKSAEFALNLSLDPQNPYLGELQSLISQAQSMASGSGSFQRDPSAPSAGSSAAAADAMEESGARHFTHEEKRYYESFKPGRKYDVQEIDPKTGKPKVDASGHAVTRQVDGKEVRHSIATTKFYATPEDKLTDEEKKLRKNSYDEKSMNDLKGSLDTLEGRKAFELQADGKDHSHELQALSEHFAKAREKVDAVNAARNSLDADMAALNSGSTMEQAARQAGLSVKQHKLDMAENALGATLQDDVLKNAMGLEAKEKKGASADRFSSQSLADNFIPPAPETQRTNGNALALH